jgi:dTDP-4-amino-4,6-dideoxygalactose transaminase
MQAAILLPKLRALLSHEISARQKVASYYNNAFKDHFTTPHIDPNNQSIYAQYALLADNQAQRDQALNNLKTANIPAMVYYPAQLSSLEVFQGTNHYKETFPNASEYCERTFSLPMHPYLTAEQQQRVVLAIKAC